MSHAQLYNPRWPLHADAHFGAEVTSPPQDLRSQPGHRPRLLVPPR